MGYEKREQSGFLTLSPAFVPFSEFLKPVGVAFQIRSYEGEEEEDAVCSVNAFLSEFMGLYLNCPVC